jgi:hypothetical protein
MASQQSVSIEEVQQYYIENNIDDYPKTKIGYPNMAFKKNRDVRTLLLSMKINAQEMKVMRQREKVKSFCASYVSGEKQECMICYEDIKSMGILECGHIFCISCVVKHGRENNVCPCCRFEFTTRPKKIEKMASQTLTSILHGHINASLPNRGINQTNVRSNEIYRQPMTIQNFISHCVTEAQYIQTQNPIYTEQSIEMRRNLETRIMNEIVHISLDVGNDIINWYNA